MSKQAFKARDANGAGRWSDFLASAAHGYMGTIMTGNWRLTGISAAAMIFVTAVPALAGAPRSAPQGALQDQVPSGHAPSVPAGSTTPGIIPTGPGASSQVPVIAAPAPILETVMS